MSSVTEMTSQTFEDTVKDGVTLIDFWAEWCGPCKMIAPVIDELAGEYEGKAKVVKVNVDNEGELAMKFSVNSIPTLIVMKDGEENKRFVGVTAKSELASALDSAAG